MKQTPWLKLTIILLASVLPMAAQARKTGTTRASISKAPEIGQSAVVIDDTLSVLREKPSLFSKVIQRMHCGRKLQILGVAEADGVRFYRVAAPPANFGWVQADAVFGRFRPNDEPRLAQLVQASSGFEQLEMANEFFHLYPDSKLRASLLLLFGDLAEDAASKLTKDAASKLKRGEMAATGAPLHSYYLNFVSLDRYRKLGITYLFSPADRSFHYDGASWDEILRQNPASPEAEEAKKRLDNLKKKMEKVAQK